jgi:SAM-dependent methyltransferase
METSWSDPVSLEYHMLQWDKPKESTIQFHKFIEQNLQKSSKVADLGCGAGASTHFIAERNPKCEFLGIDQDPKLIEIAREAKANRTNTQNMEFAVGDCFNLSKFSKSSFEGVLSMQTLSWLDSWKVPMQEIYLNLDPNWVAISSLFYPGDISAQIKISEPVRDRFTNYNVISIKEFDKHAKHFGFQVQHFEKFEIPIQIPKPLDEDIMGTYTLRVTEESGESNIQISGPILMPWFFILVERKN